MLIPKWEKQLKEEWGLFIVATPIGHCEDISMRALLTLKQVDRIVCEDTRVTKQLLSLYGIQKPCTALHAHNEETFSKVIVSWMTEGYKVALVSDRGTPLISDPGYKLVTLCYEKGIPVHVLPGPCAAIMAIVLSGLPCQSFFFQGFLPLQTKAKTNILKALSSLPQTLIFYEAPHRLEKTLTILHQVLGDRPACLVREMTKKFQERSAGTLNALLEQNQKIPAKGEIVLVVQGCDAPDNKGKISLLEEILLRHEGPLSAADLKEIAQLTSCSRNNIYRRFLELKESHPIEK